MPTPTDPAPTGPAGPAGSARTGPARTRLSGDDANPMNWLLLVPIAISLAVPFYNRTDPVLFGMPFFYWFQLAIIPIGVTCTVLVYRAHVRRQGRGR